MSRIIRIEGSASVDVAVDDDGSAEYLVDQDRRRELALAASQVATTSSTEQYTVPADFANRTYQLSVPSFALPPFPEK